MDLKKISRVSDDARSEERLRSLLNSRHSDDWRYYKNQLDKCSEDKKRERVQTWYKILLEEKPEFADKLAGWYHEYLDEDTRQQYLEKKQREIDEKERATKKRG